MSADINLHSFTGPDYSGKTVDWADRAIVPGDEIADSLKLTDHLSDFVGRFGTVVGGKEDCVDINNHCRNVEVSALRWMPKGKYLATIKGGSRKVYLAGEVAGHGSEVDVDIGNISDQSDDPTTEVYLDLKHVDGDPIAVRVINGSRPILLNGISQRYDVVLRVPPFWGSLFAKIVSVLRKLRLA